MKIMIFCEGTIFYTRPILFLFTKKGYTPIKNSVKIINGLYDEGNEIYLISYVKSRRYKFIKSIVEHYQIKYTKIICRGKGQSYSDCVEHVKPDILVEDDCKSIGGINNCCITGVREDIKKSIKSIIVSEFEGIDGVFDS